MSLESGKKPYSPDRATRVADQMLGAILPGKIDTQRVRQEIQHIAQKATVRDYIATLAVRALIRDKIPPFSQRQETGMSEETRNIFARYHYGTASPVRKLVTMIGSRLQGKQYPYK